MCLSRQVAEEHLRSRSESKDCEAFADFGNQDYCSVADLVSAVTSAGESEYVMKLVHVAVLYAFQVLFLPFWH